MAHLIRSEQALQKIADLGKSHPFLDEEARLAQQEKARVREARERLRQFAGRFKLPASTLGL